MTEKIKKFILDKFKRSAPLSQTLPLILSFMSFALFHG